MQPATQWSQVGGRVRHARLAQALTQARLAELVHLDRSAIARIEAGDRRIDALELRSLSDALQVPLPHLVSLPPLAVVSRRTSLTETPDAAGQAAFRLDVRLEEHHRDAWMLVELGYLDLPARPGLGGAGDEEQARGLARRVRQVLSLGDDPLGPLAEVCERLALLLLVVDLDADGASLQDETFGVAVLGSRADPGRRRATAAHELGHHLLGDEYSSDVGIAASRDDRECLIEAFAAELLLPSSVATHELEGCSDVGLRDGLIAVAGRWRTSWSLAVSTAARVLALSPEQRRRLLSSDPTKAEFVGVLGDAPPEDLALGATGPAWRRAVLVALRAGDLSATRAVELLHGQLAQDDLPDPAGVVDW